MGGFSSIATAAAADLRRCRRSGIGGPVRPAVLGRVPRLPDGPAAIAVRILRHVDLELPPAHIGPSSGKSDAGGCLPHHGFDRRGLFVCRRASSADAASRLGSSRQILAVELLVGGSGADGRAVARRKMALGDLGGDVTGGVAASVRQAVPGDPRAGAVQHCRVNLRLGDRRGGRQGLARDAAVGMGRRRA